MSRANGEPPTACETGLVYLLDDIDCSEDTHADVIDDLMDVHLNRPISEPVTLVISSEGGDVAGSLAIIATINRLRREGRTVNAHVAGWAFSAAFDIVQHCDHRTAEPTSALMLHQEQGDADGSTTKRKLAVAFSGKQDRAFLEVLSRRTGKPVKYYHDKTNGREWYLMAKDALAEGLIDEILAVPPFPKLALQALEPRKRRRSPQATQASVEQGDAAPIALAP